jgi:aspartyl-tRNA(Asn)/glutamyl-tRNA(Gln) amidotransferase subunit A
VFAHSVIGIMGRSAADVALSFHGMAGHDARDPMSVPLDPARPISLKGLRVAYSPRLGLGFPVDVDVQESISEAVRLFEQFGAHVEEADPAWPEGTDEAALMPLQLAGLAALYGDIWKETPDLFDPDIAAQIERGLGLTGADVANALFLREQLTRTLSEFQARFDLLVTPTTPCVAWPIDQLGPATIEGRKVSPRGHAVFTPIFNHTFVPACSVPCGLSVDGLPIGLQVVGRRFEDELVLAAVAGIEQALGGKFTKPHRV